MLPLNLPEFDPKIRDGLIFCLVRKKWIVLTAEEWVRQHFLNLIIHHLDYPKGMMKLEHSITYFKHLKRSDIIVMDRNGEVFLLVECKASSIPIDQKVLEQVSVYNKVLNATYMAVSNGMKHFIWKKENDSFRSLKEFPLYGSGRH